MKIFAKFIDTLDINEIGALWLSIRTYFISNSQLASQRFTNYNNKILKFNGNNPFQGIFNYLTEETNGNIIDNGTINAIVSSCNNNNNNIKKVLQDPGWFISNNSPNQTITFDFKDRKIKLESYTIKSANSCFMKTWDVVGSNDNLSWQNIDKQIENNSLNGDSKYDTFQVNGIKQPFRYIKIIHSGPNHGGCNKFKLNRIELFGEIIQS